MTGIEAEFLEDGGRTAADVADGSWRSSRRRPASIDVAIYDFHARGGRDRAHRRCAGSGRRARRRRPVAFNEEREAEATHNPPMTAIRR